ncbi:MAG: DUF362 domain-containing protein [Candidatus Pacebacteria bacterium]|nr:DUF362 domain-containing protein [Candidatus Paceibacterota bacterium]
MATVKIIKTKPGSVVADYQKLLASYQKSLPKNQPIIIKLNLSWTKFYPACSSPPWQLEGTIKGLLNLGFRPSRIIPVENKTVVTNVYQGAKNHAWDKVCRKYNVRFRYLPEEEYVFYQPKARLLVLDRIFPRGILLPKIIFSKPLISLCTLKTHVFTSTTGAVKNYFGMLNTRRHWAHRFIHEAIIDLLQIQKELHPQIIGLMDGSVVGYGPGPRAMKWREANLILASEDEIALDSTAASIIGLNEKKIKFLNLGKKLKLGENDLSKVKIEGVGELPNFRLKGGETLASRGQKLIYHHFPLWLEKILLQTVLVPWSYLASRLYHDIYWYPQVGQKRIGEYQKTNWGKLFKSYQEQPLK